MGRTTAPVPDEKGTPRMRNGGLIWTIVGILLIIALIIWIMGRT